MNPLWSYLWPVLCVGLLAGGLGGLFGFRRKQLAPILAGAALAIAATAAWHWLGAADRLTVTIERQSREALNHYEMFQVTAHLHRGPLTRELVFSGPAGLDDFQRGELVRLFSELPGVHSVSWSNRGAWPPLIVEGLLVALAGFLGGLLIAYLVELRRRYNAQWSW